jgi:ABC-type dipeptide/oligopeptide/nickel transport system permease subunit
MSQKSSVPFWVIRLKKFLTSLLKNKLAAVGLFLLVLFVIMATTAPFLTPYSPGTQVSDAYNSPTWITAIKGPAGYSQNIQFGPLTANSSAGITVSQSNPTAKSIDLQLSSQAQGGTVNLVETLFYPYQGPIKNFVGFATLEVSDPQNQSFTVAAFLERVGENTWTVWGPNVVNGTNSYSPKPEIRSDNFDFNRKFLQNSQFSTAQYFFAPRPATYHYILQIALPAGITNIHVKVSNFSMHLLGNTWGIFGTDDQGHDIFTQLVYGSRLSLEVGLIATGIGIGLGLLVGLMAGYLGKVVDEILMRFTDMLLVIPGLPLLIVLVATVGPNLLYIILYLGFFGWMGFARVVRSQVLSLRERPFIEAAKASGAGTGYITVRHIFPNIVSLTYVSLALSVPAAIVSEAALSFLGLGDPTVVTWGSMLGNAEASGGTASSLAWWWILPPGFAIALISLSFILLGYAMDELFNPRLRRRR